MSTPSSTPTTRAQLARARKIDLLAFLDAQGAEYSSKESVEELRARALKLCPIAEDIMRGLPSMGRPKLLLLALDLGLTEFNLKSTKGEILMGIRAAVEGPTAVASQRGSWLMNFGLHKEKPFAVVEKEFPDYSDWCRAAFRTEPQISSHLALFVGYLNREIEMEVQGSAAASGSVGPVEIRDKLTKVKAELLKPKTESPEESASSASDKVLRVPQWDGEESSFEAYMLRCRQYAHLKKQWQEGQ